MSADWLMTRMRELIGERSQSSQMGIERTY